MAYRLTVLCALTASDEWGLRAFDYPRLPITIGSIIVLSLALLLFRWRPWWHALYLALLGMAAGDQRYVLYPY